MIYFCPPHNSFKQGCIYLFLERGEGREKGRETLIGWLPLVHALTGDRTCNSGMCPDQESNQQTFPLQDDAQLSHTSQGRITHSLIMYIINVHHKIWKEDSIFTIE